MSYATVRLEIKTWDGTAYGDVVLDENLIAAAPPEGRPDLMKWMIQPAVEEAVASYLGGK